MEDGFKQEYCVMLLEHMKAGLSFSSFSAVVNKHRATLDRWKKKYPEFEEAYQLGKGHSKLFWENLGIHGAAGKLKGFNPAAWIFNMKNRFDWRDKREIDNRSSDGSMSPNKSDLSKLSIEELETLIKISEKAESSESEIKKDEEQSE